MSQQRYPEVRGDPFVAFPHVHHFPVAGAIDRNLPPGDVEEAIERFGPLRDVLEAIPTVYASQEVRRKSPSQTPLLTNKFPGIRRY